MSAYVVVEDGTPLPEGEFELALDAPGALSVYRNMEALPRAWVVHEATAAPDMAAAVEAIQSPDFDPGRDGGRRGRFAARRCPAARATDAVTVHGLCGRSHDAGCACRRRRIAGVERGVVSGLACDGERCRDAGAGRERRAARRSGACRRIRRWR